MDPKSITERPGRRGPRPMITRELAVDLVRARMLDGTVDPDGTRWPVRTLRQFALEQAEHGLMNRVPSTTRLSQLFSGRLFPDLEVDGEKVDWSSLPVAGRGRMTGERSKARDGRTLLDHVESLNRRLDRLEARLEALLPEVSQ